MARCKKCGAPIDHDWFDGDYAVFWFVMAWFLPVGLLQVTEGK